MRCLKKRLPLLGATNLYHMAEEQPKKRKGYSAISANSFYPPHTPEEARYYGMKRTELAKLASEYRIAARSRMNKEELIEAIMAAGKE